MLRKDTSATVRLHCAAPWQGLQLAPWVSQERIPYQPRGHSVWREADDKSWIVGRPLRRSFLVINQRSCSGLDSSERRPRCPPSLSALVTAAPWLTLTNRIVWHVLRWSLAHKAKFSMPRRRRRQPYECPRSSASRLGRRDDVGRQLPGFTTTTSSPWSISGF